MISVEEAKRWVLDKSFTLREELIPIDQSVGRVLAHDVLSVFDIPLFRNSAMDGYAMLRDDLENGMRVFKVAGEIQAGRSEKIEIKSGETYRIFTGAVVPDNCDMVVIQEKTNRGDDEVEVNLYNSKDKSNIREIGEQLKKGEVALEKGHELNPASIGLLASFGITEILVYSKPRISVITTGNELKRPGEELALGEIFESNSFSLKAALDQHHFTVAREHRTPDDKKQTIKDIGELLRESEVLILSGGISVGDYDFVKESLEKNGVEEVFYKVNQKPGKPMFFGVKDEKLIFALPGNPASLLVCFYEYVLPSLNKLMGKKEVTDIKYLKIKHDLDYKGNRPEFMRAYFEGDEVEMLKGQSSFMLKSFADANCLMYIHGPQRFIKKGDEVEVHPIY